MRKFVMTSSVALIVSSCGSVAGNSAMDQCKFFDVHGLPVTNVEATFSDPVRHAERDFGNSKLQFAVVRDRFGRTVTPLVESLDPVHQEQIEGGDRARRIWTRLTEQLDGKYALLPLQEDVRGAPTQSEVNFINVENPCFDRTVYDYAAAYNTHMLRLAYERFGLQVDF